MTNIAIEFKTLLLLLCLAAGWMLEYIAPLQRASRQRAVEHVRHDLKNLCLAAIATAANSALVVLLLFPVLQLTAARQWGLLNWPGLPGWIIWPMALVLFDLWQYGWHVLNHRLPWLWRFHVVHHADTAMDTSSGLRFHFIEIALSTLIRVPLVMLLGLQLQHLLVYELIALPVVLFHHSNLRLPLALDRLLRIFIVTPRMHWVHHSDQRIETDSNYASVLTLWDRLFGSYRGRDNFADLQLGVRGEAYLSLRDMLLVPLRRRR
ncbi:MAG: sterol desaturase family protein [Gammaproteobacteria bacterium]|nr:sterol desaturase family protein [Gammaproteobacteria bacterium]